MTLISVGALRNLRQLVPKPLGSVTRSEGLVESRAALMSSSSHSLLIRMPRRRPSVINTAVVHQRWMRSQLIWRKARSTVMMTLTVQRILLLRWRRLRYQLAASCLLSPARTLTVRTSNPSHSLSSRVKTRKNSSAIVRRRRNLRSVYPAERLLRQEVMVATAAVSQL